MAGIYSRLFLIKSLRCKGLAACAGPSVITLINSGAPNILMRLSPADTSATITLSTDTGNLLGSTRRLSQSTSFFAVDVTAAVQDIFLSTGDFENILLDSEVFVQLSRSDGSAATFIPVGEGFVEVESPPAGLGGSGTVAKFTFEADGALFCFRCCVPVMGLRLDTKRPIKKTNEIERRARPLAVLLCMCL